MDVSTADISRLRRMVADTESPYTRMDDEIEDVILRYPVVDARGEAPWVESTTTPGTLEENDDWTDTFDLNAAAAEIWAEKAAGYAAKFDFSADGGSFNRSQLFEQAQRMERHYRSRRNPNTITLRPEPRPDWDELLEIES